MIWMMINMLNPMETNVGWRIDDIWGGWVVKKCKKKTYIGDP